MLMAMVVRFHLIQFEVADGLQALWIQANDLAHLSGNSNFWWLHELFWTLLWFIDYQGSAQWFKHSLVGVFGDCLSILMMKFSSSVLRINITFDWWFQFPRRIWWFQHSSIKVTFTANFTWFVPMTCTLIVQFRVFEDRQHPASLFLFSRWHWV